MSITIDLDPASERLLREAAGEDQLSPEAFAQRELLQSLQRRKESEALRQVQRAFVLSGMTDDELGDMLQDAKHEMRRARRSRQ